MKMLGKEIEIQTPPTVGGADIALVNGGGFVRINSVNEGRLVPLIAEISTEPSAEIEFQAVDLGNDNIDTFLPPNAAVFADHLGIIHVPIPSLVDGQYVLLDHVPNHFTRAVFERSESAWGFPNQSGYLIHASCRVQEVGMDGTASFNGFARALDRRD
jgi:hypothetical protein